MSDDDNEAVSMHKHVVEQNIRMIGQLQLAGRPAPLLLPLSTVVETIIDMFVPEEQRPLFHTMVDMNLHAKLEHLLEEVNGLAVE